MVQLAATSVKVCRRTVVKRIRNVERGQRQPRRRLDERLEVLRRRPVVKNRRFLVEPQVEKHQPVAVFLRRGARVERVFGPRRPLRVRPEPVVRLVAVDDEADRHFALHLDQREVETLVQMPIFANPRRQRRNAPDLVVRVEIADQIHLARRNPTLERVPVFLRRSTVNLVREVFAAPPDANAVFQLLRRRRRVFVADSVPFDQLNRLRFPVVDAERPDVAVPNPMRFDQSQKRPKVVSLREMATLRLARPSAELPLDRLVERSVARRASEPEVRNET